MPFRRQNHQQLSDQAPPSSGLPIHPILPCFGSGLLKYPSTMLACMLAQRAITIIYNIPASHVANPAPSNDSIQSFLKDNRLFLAPPYAVSCAVAPLC